MMGATYLEGPTADPLRSVLFSLIAIERDKEHFNQYMNLGVACLQFARQGVSEKACPERMASVPIFLEASRYYLHLAIEVLRRDPNTICDGFLTEQWAKTLIFIGDGYSLSGDLAQANRFAEESIACTTIRAVDTANGFIIDMNDIWTKQANIVFTMGTVDSPTVPTDLGVRVEWASTEPANEWDNVVASRRGGAPDIYFVWDYEQGGPAGTDADGAELGGDILMEDAAGADVGESLAHEMGHYLGITPFDYADRPNQLMHKYADVRGRKILHDQVDQANP